MNQFQSVDSGKGMLKDYYDAGEASSKELSQAIKKRKEKLVALDVAKDDEPSDD